LSIILESGENSGLWESKEGNTSLNLLSILTIGLLIIFHYHGVSKSNKK